MAFGQDIATSWTKSFEENVQWQKVTTLGHYIVGTATGIMSVDPANGDVLWKINQGSLESEQVTQVGSSPLLSINRESSVTMIDPFTGETLFDSQEAGIFLIRDQLVLYRSNGIVVSGKTSTNKDILLVSSLSTGEVVWRLEDDFGRFITASDLSTSEILVVTLYNNYRVNTTTGEVIWKNDVSEANEQLKNMGAFGGLMKQVASTAAQSIDFNVRFYRNPFQPVFFTSHQSRRVQPKRPPGFHPLPQQEALVITPHTLLLAWRMVVDFGRMIWTSTAKWEQSTLRKMAWWYSPTMARVPRSICMITLHKRGAGERKVEVLESKGVFMTTPNRVTGYC